MNPMEVMEDVNCMMFGFCKRKQLKLKERKKNDS